jgi:hypothetical protein
MYTELLWINLLEHIHLNIENKIIRKKREDQIKIEDGRWMELPQNRVQ